jgi:hypothetical protein
MHSGLESLCQRFRRGAGLPCEGRKCGFWRENCSHAARKGGSDLGSVVHRGSVKASAAAVAAGYVDACHGGAALSVDAIVCVGQQHNWGDILTFFLWVTRGADSHRLATHSAIRRTQPELTLPATCDTLDCKWHEGVGGLAPRLSGRLAVLSLHPEVTSATPGCCSFLCHYHHYVVSCICASGVCHCSMVPGRMVPRPIVCKGVYRHAAFDSRACMPYGSTCGTSHQLSSVIWDGGLRPSALSMLVLLPVTLACFCHHLLACEQSASDAGVSFACWLYFDYLGAISVGSELCACSQTGAAVSAGTSLHTFLTLAMTWHLPDVGGCAFSLIYGLCTS